MFENIVPWVQNMCVILIIIFLGMSILVVALGISNKLSGKK